MELKEHFKKSIEIGLCWGIGLGTFLFIMVTASLWWDNTFKGIKNYEREDIELRCYKTLEKESCEKLFNPDNN